nr:uncharacterized protein LOC112293233 [Physcomitrium patens]|eukprot:XP_024398200.1 uncharacterized protein LOC112293233 [Physcomitrella patens]
MPPSEIKATISIVKNRSFEIEQLGIVPNCGFGGNCTELVRLCLKPLLLDCNETLSGVPQSLHRHTMGVAELDFDDTEVAASHTSPRKSRLSSQFGKVECGIRVPVVQDPQWNFVFFILFAALSYGLHGRGF